jgi:hypothetical protein
LHYLVGNAGQPLPDLVGGDLGKAGPGVAGMLAELAFEEPLDVGAFLGTEPAAFDEQVSDGGGLLAGPEGAGFDEPGRVKTVGLECEDGEEEVPVGLLGGHLWPPRLRIAEPVNHPASPYFPA